MQGNSHHHFLSDLEAKQHVVIILITVQYVMSGRDKKPDCGWKLKMLKTGD